MAFPTTCPTSLTEKVLASKRLGCGKDLYGNDQYICAPNEAKTSLVEICNNGIMGIIEDGNCLSVAGTKFKTVSCRNFSSGCPAQVYMSYESYTHNACQKINTQLHCYEMDPACQLQVPDEETESHIMILGWIIAAVSLVVVLFFSVYFGMKFRGSDATCADMPNRIKETDDKIDTTDIEMNGLEEGHDMSDTDKELSEIDCENTMISGDIRPPENQELALGDRSGIKFEGQEEDMTRHFTIWVASQ